MKTIVILENGCTRGLFMEVFKRTGDYIKTKEKLLTSYGYTIRLEIK